MKRCLGALALVIGLVGGLAAPASADAYNPPAHHYCPNGLEVALDGGSGFKAVTRDAINWYNWMASQAGREGWPKITSIREKFNFDGKVYIYNRCTIDVDEAYSVNCNGDAAACATFASDSAYHMYGCGVTFAGKYWSGGDFYDHYAARQELMHCIGLAHNFDEPDSVMSYHFKRLELVYNDLTTLSHYLYTRAGHH